MKGLPKILQTKKDYLNMVELARQGEIDPQALVAALDNLLATRQAKFMRPEAEGKKAEDLTDEDFELQDSPYSEMARLGFTVDEIENLKGGL